MGKRNGDQASISLIGRRGAIRSTGTYRRLQVAAVVRLKGRQVSGLQEDQDIRD